MGSNLDLLQLKIMDFQYFISVFQASCTVVCHPNEMKKNESNTKPECWKNCGKLSDMLHCWWNCRLVQLLTSFYSHPAFVQANSYFCIKRWLPVKACIPSFLYTLLRFRKQCNILKVTICTVIFFIIAIFPALSFLDQSFELCCGCQILDVRQSKWYQIFS